MERLGTCRYRSNWNTVSFKVLSSRASKTVSHKETALKLDALKNRKPVNGVSAERRDIEELCDAPWRRAAALRTDCSLDAFADERPTCTCM